MLSGAGCVPAAQQASSRAPCSHDSVLLQLQHRPRPRPRPRPSPRRAHKALEDPTQKHGDQRLRVLLCVRVLLCAPTQIVVPVDLADVLKAYTKEVIRRHPKDLLEFSAK